MLMNNLDSEVAERPEDLVVYGGIGKAARTWGDFDRITAALRRLEGRPDAAGAVRQAGSAWFRTHADAPRVLIANSPQSGATLGRLAPFRRARPQGPDDVRPDDRGQLDLYRQPGNRPGPPTRRSPRPWRRHYGGSLGGRWILTAGLGGMGGGAAAGGGVLRRLLPGRGVRPSDRIEMRRRTRYLDDRPNRARRCAGDDRKRWSRGQGGEVGRAPRQRGGGGLPELVRRGVRFPIFVTDQTSAHDSGQRLSCRSAGRSANGARSGRVEPRPRSRKAARHSMRTQFQRGGSGLGCRRAGCSTTATTSRQGGQRTTGLERAFRLSRPCVPAL